MEFRFHELGWKAFQDFCATVLTESFGSSFQLFAQSNDGGRDGAFSGRSENFDGEELAGETVVQCKHFNKESASLTPNSIAEEIGKIQKLVDEGICENYILISNGLLSGKSEQIIKDLVKKAGVRKCYIFGREWLTARVLESKKLRALTPRLYGLGDLSEIIDERAYRQAQALLESLKYDIETFVPTRSYVKAVDALNEFGLVLLLGEPASGKSVIASVLSLISTDSSGSELVKIDSPDQFVKHWNPDLRNQFFWIDDMFGSTQLRNDSIQAWNQALPIMRAAARSGSRFVMTSRDYIWKEALSSFKFSAWSAISLGEITIRVEDLTLEEKQKILYNHVRLGNQPYRVKCELKEFLPAIAESNRFLPEIARRLGDVAFTKSLAINESALKRFVERPEELLISTIKHLSEAHRAALVLLTVSDSVLTVPIEFGERGLETLSLLGSSGKDIKRAFTELEGSFVKIDVDESGRKFWVPKHPTITDAVTTLFMREPEYLDHYLRIADHGRMLKEISCGAPRERSLIVPEHLYRTVQVKLEEFKKLGGDAARYQVLSFLNYRCGVNFWITYAQDHPDAVRHSLANLIKSNIERFGALWRELSGAGLTGDGLLPELIDLLKEHCIEYADLSYSRCLDFRELVGEAVIQEVDNFIRAEIPRRLVTLREQANQDPIWDAEREGLYEDFERALSDLEMEELAYMIDECRQACVAPWEDEYDVWRDETASVWGENSRPGFLGRNIFDDVDGAEGEPLVIPRAEDYRTGW